MKLSRRQVLRSAAGVSLALPLLPEFAHAQQAPPKRFFALYSPNGVFTPQWFPTAGTSPSDFTLGPIHQPLAALKSHCLFLSGVDLKVAVSGAGEQHQRGLGALLTGARLNAGTFVGNDGTTAGWANGPSIDQVLAGRIGATTAVRSLELGVNTRERDVSGVLAYGAANMPLLPQTDPALTFKRLFLGGTHAGGEAEALRVRRQSVLDTVLDQISKVKQKVGARSVERLDAHFTRLRELEKRLTAVAPGTCTTPQEPPTVSPNDAASMDTITRLQLDLMVMAFQCDLTRVATFMVSDAKNHTAMPFICRPQPMGPNKCVTEDVHNLTHLPDSEPGREKVAWRDLWVMQQFAYVMDQLATQQDVGGTPILDNTLMFFGSDVSRGNVHAHDNMPLMLAGHATGWPMGRYVQFQNRPHNDLLTSILRGFGGSETNFGDPAFSTGPLPLS